MNFLALFTAYSLLFLHLPQTSIAPPNPKIAAKLSFKIINKTCITKAYEGFLQGVSVEKIVYSFIHFLLKNVMKSCFVAFFDEISKPWDNLEKDFGSTSQGVVITK